MSAPRRHAAPGARGLAARLAGLTLFAAATLSSCGAGDGSGSGTAAADALPAGGALGAAGCARGFNLLLVTFDTVRADALHCYGDAGARTPVVDALAARGVRFERALSPVPLTLPAHATILTGRDPDRLGVRNNGTFRLGAQHVTLAERLAQAGYSTGAVVGSFVLGKCFGLAQGFTDYDDQLQTDGSAAFEGHFLERRADKVTDSAIRWLGRQDGAPFFLWVHYYDAHAEYDPPEGFTAPDVRKRGQLAAWDPAEVRSRYLGEIAFADSELGRLLAALGSERLQRTLVVFTSDHGEGLGEHNEFTHGILVYDATMRVPLIVSCPALFDRGYVVRDRIAGLVDVVPTALAMLGIEAVAPLDGVSLFDAPADPKRALYGESLVPLLDHGWAPLYSLARLDGKYIRSPKPEYYDARADPAELRNLLPGAAAAAAELERALAARIATAAPAASDAERELDPAEARRLAALGYVHVPRAKGAIGSADPKDMMPVWVALTNAQTMSQRGDFERALQTVQNVLRAAPDDPFAWETAYAVHQKRGAWAEAEACIKKNLELKPTCEAYVRLVPLLLRRGAVAESIDALERAGALDPLNGDVMLLRGDCYLREELHDLARSKYEQALTVDPIRSGAAARESLRRLAEHVAGG